MSVTNPNTCDIKCVNSDELIRALIRDNKILRRLEFNEEYLDGRVESKYLYVFCDKEYKFLELKGWGSGVCNKAYIVYDIVMYPNKWEITNYKIEDYPWK